MSAALAGPGAVVGPVALVGAGALGSALAARLAKRGMPPSVVVSPGGRSAARVARAVGADASGDLADTRAAAVVVVAVPDAALAEVVAALARDGGPWAPGGVARLVAHTSGAVGADVLAPIVDLGAEGLAFHPAQAFAAGTPPEAFEGAAVALGGEARALDRGRALAAVLGMRPVVVPDASRAAYHLALSVASNFAVALAAVAAEILGTAGLPRGDAAALVGPLLAGTVANLARARPEEALSGPIVRGDAVTVGRHLAALADAAPHLTPVYAALATETVRVAVRSGRLPPAAAEVVLDRLSEALKET